MVRKLRRDEVVFGMMFFGCLYRVLDYSLTLNTAGILIATTVYSHLLNIETDFADVFGGMPILISLLYVFIRLLPGEVAGAPQHVGLKRRCLRHRCVSLTLGHRQGPIAAPPKNRLIELTSCAVSPPCRLPVYSIRNFSSALTSVNCPRPMSGGDDSFFRTR